MIQISKFPSDLTYTHLMCPYCETVKFYARLSETDNKQLVELICPICDNRTQLKTGTITQKEDE